MGINICPVLVPAIAIPTAVPFLVVKYSLIIKNVEEAKKPNPKPKIVLKIDFMMVPV